MEFGKKGGLAIESLAALVLVVFTAAGVFFLVSSGMLSVEGSTGSSGSSVSESLLNVEFIPVSAGGVLVTENFKFCALENLDQICRSERDVFYLGEEVHFSFEVISSAMNGRIEVYETYQVYGPDGSLLLSVDDVDDIKYEVTTSESLESIFFHDYFVLGDESPIGEYTLELVMKNPLVSKESAVRKTVTVLP